MKSLDDVCRSLVQGSNALGALIIDRRGQEIARAGDLQIDAASLKLMIPDESRIDIVKALQQDEEHVGAIRFGDQAQMHLSLIGARVILAVVFDPRSSLGLVRLRVKKATELILRILDGGGSSDGSGGSGDVGPTAYPWVGI